MPVPLRIRAVARAAFTDDLLARLHALANRLLIEDLEHFRVHAATNDVVHVFERADTGELAGFQFWRTTPFDLPRSRAILGGKLRIVPEHRRRGLHLRSGLRFYAASQLRHPRTRFYRLAIASMFGFVSITEALAGYHLFDPRAPGAEGRALRAAFERLAAENGFRLDDATGLVDVRIRIAEETAARYPASYFERPAARAYAAINPGWRDNTCDVAFWFRFTPTNLAALGRAIWRRRA
jgi:hypothetical protein